MQIRRAAEKDTKDILHLLEEVCMVHHKGRPDLFKGPATKYNAEELSELYKDSTRPIFVAAEGDKVLGYAFCVYKQEKHDNILTDIKTLYIDDLCVEEALRGKHIGRSLYDYVVDFAKKEGFYNVTLNVWACNPSAMKFYESCGLKPQKIGMEVIL